MADEIAPKTFSRMWPGKPANTAASTAATAAVSLAPNAPRSNNPPAIGSAKVMNATADGSARPNAISNARDCAAASVLRSPTSRLAAMRGPSTEATATETTPSGSS